MYPWLSLLLEQPVGNSCSVIIPYFKHNCWTPFINLVKFHTKENKLYLCWSFYIYIGRFVQSLHRKKKTYLNIQSLNMPYQHKRPIVHIWMILQRNLWEKKLKHLYNQTPINVSIPMIETNYTMYYIIILVGMCFPLAHNINYM